MPSSDLLAPIAARIAAVAGEILGTPAPDVDLSPPADPAHGDLATPVAMAMAKGARRLPRELAQELCERLLADGGGAIVAAEVAGPGFVNLRLSEAWFAALFGQVAANEEGYGAGSATSPEHILVEFVSANPTGPMHVGHARNAILGDDIARLLAFAGHRVTREFYVNDYGRQVELFGQSVAAHYAPLVGRELAAPEDGYAGDYLAEVAWSLHARHGKELLDVADPTPEIGRLAGEIMLERLSDELSRFGVTFDSFFSERSMHEAGTVGRAIETLIASRDAYESEGAVWFRTTAYEDEKDRVLRRSDGSTTYIAADVAYHLDKAGRADRLIDVLGADHHGYIARLRAVLSAGGYDPDRLEVALYQLVSLIEEGEAVRMSKRAGTLVTLTELIDDIGVDAARFFLAQRSHETTLELDMALAREQSRENPVYYVQYVHARCCNILVEVGGRDPAAEVPTIGALDPAERALGLRLAIWPQVVAEATMRRSPHRVATYLIELARDFHSFYHRCHVIGQPPDVRAFRLAVVVATRNVVATALGLLGVSAPQRM